MSDERDDREGGPRPDVPGFLLLLVLAALVGGALLAGVRCLLRWLETGSP